MISQNRQKWNTKKIKKLNKNIRPSKLNIFPGSVVGKFMEIQTNQNSQLIKKALCISAELCT